MNNALLNRVLNDTSAVLNAALKADPAQLELQEAGTVLSVGGGVARVNGLWSVKAEELVTVSGNLQGIATNLDEQELGVILLDDGRELAAGARVYSTGRIVDTPVGEGLIGRVIDAMGRPLDDRGPLPFSSRRPIERSAPPIIDRDPVTMPMQTGIKVVDALIPIGRGQRELIIGDRQTGKTSVAVDTILNQHDQDVLCVYCAIAQRGTAVARVVDTLRQYGALAYTIVVVGSGDAPPGLQFITPYAATTMAEYFRDQGRDVLIVYDDLTCHARAYRELSLLLRRPPGREAYPGDIFYIHSRLLERATVLKEAVGGGSLTALPIVETQAQDISAYIPTNLISITDGQIYLSPQLFHRGHLPAIDVGKSVSRVGGKTQFPAFRAVAGDLRLAYAQFEELETFARFASRLDAKTRSMIEHGRRVREVLKQKEHAPLRAGAQIGILKTVTAGLFDDVPLEMVADMGEALQQRIVDGLPDLCVCVEEGATLDEKQWKSITDLAVDSIADVSGPKYGLN
ncbi:alternate F1F0 ATPase, F1 subunit alpha [Congregibacter variabilis]|uniref:ATP synthase subunit alpha n=1 Tax=Congregibacter variabilis TaxID=3081200 RepID=A0ABZ0I0V1_9GAMM|nr:alternate F1F0 ATPase, F1 subunit alpha [Congregibacter sp. IMCC43200]